MHYVMLTVDRVLGLERRVSSKTGKFSVFGFDVGGKEFRGMRAWGWPPIYDGMTITAALKFPADVRSLKGWYDHRTGQVVSPSPAGLHWLAGALWLLLAGLIVGAFAVGERSNAPAISYVVAGAALAAGAICSHAFHGKYKALRHDLAREGARQRLAARGH